MGSLLACCGEKGRRFALPNARIMIHQPSGGFEGTAADISIQAQEILRLKDALYDILSKHTGHSIDEIRRQSDRDFFMSAEEAITNGLVDKVLSPKNLSRDAKR